VLRLRLNPGEEVIVNGAVLRNGDRRNVLTVANAANVLRARDLIRAEDAVTPSRQVCFLIQAIMLANGSDKSNVKPKIRDMLADMYVRFASDEAKAQIIEVMDQFSSEDYYKSLNAMKKLVIYEDSLLGRDRAAEGGKPDVNAY